MERARRPGRCRSGSAARRAGPETAGPARWARARAPAARWPPGPRATTRRRVSRVVAFTHPRVGGRQEEIAGKRADRKKERSHGGATGDEIDVACAQRLVHQPAETRPGRDVLDDERP